MKRKIAITGIGAAVSSLFVIAASQVAMADEELSKRQLDPNQWALQTGITASITAIFHRLIVPTSRMSRLPGRFLPGVFTVMKARRW